LTVKQHLICISESPKAAHCVSGILPSDAVRNQQDINLTNSSIQQNSDHIRVHSCLQKAYPPCLVRFMSICSLAVWVIYLEQVLVVENWVTNRFRY